MSLNIRFVNLNDAKRISEIYSYYVLNTAITFEYIPPTEEEFKARITNITEKYPYLVLEEDQKVVGYAYAHPHHERRAYDWTCEVSIYLDKDSRGNGYGKMLYDKLISYLKKMGIVNVYVLVAYTDNEDEYLVNKSSKFHEHYGFKEIGHFTKTGYKFNRWYDILILEIVINEKTNNIKDVININEIKES